MAFYDENGNKRFLDLEGLAYYDEKIKSYVDAAQSEADGAAAQALVDAKAYTDEKIGTLGDGLTTVAQAIAAEALRADTAEKANAKAIEDEAKRADEAEKANKKAIEDEATRAGQAEQVLTEAVEAAQKAADDAQADVDALDELVGFEPTEEGPQTVKAYIDAKVEEINGDADDLEARVKANEDAIDVINGEGEGSIKNAVNTAVTNLVDGAPEALDTLKEIADWIADQGETGEDGVTELISKITVNANAIAAEKTRAEAAELGLSNRLAALEGDGEGSVADQIKDAVEALDAEKDQEASATQGLSLHIKEVDGKITEFSGDIATVAKSDIDKLFPVEEETV